MEYNSTELEIQQTETFETWFDHLRDRQARSRIDTRVRRLQLGNPGDVKPVGGGVSELRIDFGPGYRVYFVSHGPSKATLLLGGTKRTQPADITRARVLAAAL